MTEKGTILNIDGTIATIGCTTGNACQSCAGSAVCGGSKREERTYTARIETEEHIEVGDLVEIFMPPGKTIMAAFMVMIFPLIIFAAGFLLAGVIMPNWGDMGKALFGFAGLGLGFCGTLLFNRFASVKHLPLVTKRLGVDLHRFTGSVPAETVPAGAAVSEAAAADSAV